jgi:glycosyltransferase involved in cell wall biosynthesis
MRVSVIIPTRNEAQSLPRVLADIPAGLVNEVLVVDSDSSDGTPEIAASLGARVIREQRRGYGQACLTGIAHANSPDVVVFLDGDYSDRPAELPLLLQPIAERRADITTGSRLAGPRTRGAMAWHAVFGNRLAARLIGVLFGQRLTDLGPFRAARVEVLRSLALEETTYGWAVEMILKGAMQGYRSQRSAERYVARSARHGLSSAGFSATTFRCGASVRLPDDLTRIAFRRRSDWDESTASAPFGATIRRRAPPSRGS